MPSISANDGLVVNEWADPVLDPVVTEPVPPPADFMAVRAPADPVPVADQKAAGVPPEQTVTIADQKAGVPPPDLVSAPATRGAP